MLGQQHRALRGTAGAIVGGALHGLVSCSEWTGVPLSAHFFKKRACVRRRWLLAEGADAAAMSRSVPIDKALDDALIAIYQNGERLRPENGYPDAPPVAGLGRQHERQVAAASSK